MSYNQVRLLLFHILIEEKPVFFDIIDTVIGYILPNQLDEKTFTIINVGCPENLSREIDIKEPSPLREISHEFESESDKEVGIRGFHPIEENEDSGYSTFSKCDILEEDEIVKVHDFSCEVHPTSDMIQYLLVERADNVFQLLKTGDYGKNFEDEFLKFDNNQDEIKSIFGMRLIHVNKIVAILKNQDDNQPCLQVIEFNDGMNPFKFANKIPIFDQYIKQNSQKMLKSIVIDGLNNCFYLEYEQIKKQKMKAFEINNNYSMKEEKVKLSLQVTMNLIGNNVQLKNQQENSNILPKTKGLFYKDFRLCGDTLILLHGKLITLIDIMRNQNDPQHLVIRQDKEKSSFEWEPYRIWMNDKAVPELSKRYQIIIQLTNGKLKELRYDEKTQKYSSLENYLVDVEGQPAELPGKIVKIIRDKNSVQQPVYFIIEKSDQKRVLATIEFQSKTYREYEIEGTNNDSIYIILSYKDFIQKVLVINFERDQQGDIINQTILKVNLKIGQYQVNNEVIIKDKKVIALKKGDLIGQKKTFVNGKIIYLFKDKTLFKYDSKNNSMQSGIFNDTIKKWINLDQSFCYWRTLSQKDKFESKIHLAAVGDIAQLAIRVKKSNLTISSGTYPHCNKIQFDKISESLVFFKDYTTINIYPYLHQTRIKLRIKGFRCNDSHILITKLIQDKYIAILNNQNILSLWDLSTGKLLKERILTSEEGDFKGYYSIVHQRINQNYSMIRRSIMDCETYEDSVSMFRKQFNWHEAQNEHIKTCKYQILEIQLASKDLVEDYKIIIKQLKVVALKQFLGPFDSQNVNYGLFSNNSISKFIFQYLDHQEKFKIKYAQHSSPALATTTDNFLEQAQILSKGHLSSHSPDFQFYISEKDNQYVLKNFKNQLDQILPETLNRTTIQHPHFISNNEIAFLSSDLMIKVHSIKNHSYLISHCKFPGSEGKINLRSLMKLGSHIIGEDCLIYEYYEQSDSKQNKRKIYEYLAPNNFNKFFKEIFSGKDDDDIKKEKEWVQCHYKTKIEIGHRGYQGYIFQQKEQIQIGIQFEATNEIYAVFTYSYFDWRLIESITEKQQSIQNLNKSLLQNICYLQLPTGKSLLHLIFKNKEELENLFNIIEMKKDYQDFYVPFLLDQRKKNVLHYSLGMEHEDIPERQTALRGNQENNIQISNQDQHAVLRKQTELLLRHISTYPFDLFKVKLKKKQIAKMISQNITGLSQFMDNCLKQPDCLKYYDRAYLEIDKDCGCYVFESSDIWNKNNIEFQKLFFQKGASEKQIQLKVLNIPQIHHLSEKNKNFIYKALDDERVDDNLFQSLSIRALIEQKWSITKKQIIYKLFIPYMILVTIFTSFVLFDFETQTGIFQATMRGIMYLLVLYFLKIELSQLKKALSYREHFTDIWNMLDIAIPILILPAEVIHFTSDVNYTDCVQQVKIQEKVFYIECGREIIIRGIYALTSFLIWLRFLYYFRVIKATGYQIRMIIEVIRDMGQFFIIFTIAVFSFTLSTFIIQNNGFTAEAINENSDLEKLTLMQNLIISFRNSIGDLQGDHLDSLYGSNLAWLFMILCSLIMVIVLLNLLIAIVGNTFQRVQDNRKSMMYRDLASLIVENQFLISKKNLQSTMKGEYLVLVIEAGQEIEIQQNLDKKITKIKASIKRLNQAMIKNKEETQFIKQTMWKNQQENKEETQFIKQTMQKNQQEIINLLTQR